MAVTQDAGRWSCIFRQWRLGGFGVFRRFLLTRKRYAAPKSGVLVKALRCNRRQRSANHGVEIPCSARRRFRLTWRFHSSSCRCGSSASCRRRMHRTVRRDNATNAGTNTCIHRSPLTRRWFLHKNSGYTRPSLVSNSRTRAWSESWVTPYGPSAPRKTSSYRSGRLCDVMRTAETDVTARAKEKKR